MAFIIPRNPTLIESLVQAGGLALPGLVAGGQNRALQQFAQQQGLNLPQGLPPELAQRLVQQSFDPFGSQQAQADLVRARLGQVGLPTPLDPTTQAFRQAQTQQTIAQTGQIGQPAPVSESQQKLTEARTKLAEAQARQAGKPTPTTAEETEAKKALTELRKAQAELARTKARVAGKGLTSAEKTATTTTFRKEFNALSVDFRKIRDSFERIKAAANDPSAAGDLAIIFNFMKILDPGSVVRESEFATAENAAGVPDKIRNMWNRALTGERITFNRQDFVDTSQRLFRAQQNTQKRLINRYTTLSNRFGLNPQDVITETREIEQQPQGDVLSEADKARLAELEARE